MTTAPALPPLEQPEVGLLPEGAWDVVVAGAGPAGAMAALHLARRGRRVLLLDRERFPRDKVCGDGLIPDALNALDRAGILDRVRGAAASAREVRLFSPSRVEVRLPCELLTLRRERLDQIVTAAAVERGAVFARGEVLDVSASPDGVAVACRGLPAPLRARAALLACGADVAVPRRLGMISRRRPSALALRCYVRSGTVIDELIVSFDRSILPGYAWIFPMGDGEYNVGCAAFDEPNGAKVNLKKTLERFVAEFPLARRLYQRSFAVTPLRGAPLRCGLTGAQPSPLPGALAVGEGIGTTFDLTGEGIGKAMESGELAAEAIDAQFAGGVRDAAKHLRDLVEDRLRPRYLGYELGGRWMSRPFVCDLVFWRARRSPYLRAAASGILAETVDPADVFSVKGLVLSFLR